MTYRTSFVSVMLASALALAFQPTVAAACGGCFHQQRAPSSVLGHRMVLSVSATQTTLWDQFNYAGNPNDFAWILPIHYDPAVRIAVADDRFPAALERLTPQRLATPPPPPSCPFCQPFCQPPWHGLDAANAADVPAARDSSVVVQREEIVGPYQVAIVSSANAMDLRDWLTANGYSVPPAIEPVIDYYVAQRSDFVALRLRAGVGVSQMTPIRVTVPGYAPTLPLRMVAAGVADLVGLDLFVIAASRFEAMNFPNAVITSDDFTFNYATQTWPPNPFIELNDAVQRAYRSNGGRTWLTQVARPTSAIQFNVDVQRQAQIFRAQPPVCNPSAGDAGGVRDVIDVDGGCREPNFAEDITVATTGLGRDIWLTRMNARLSAAMLDRDLQLAASVNNTPVSGELTYGHQLNFPPAPVCQPCEDPCRDGGVPMGFDVLQMGFDIPGDARTIRPDGGFDVPYVIADTGSIIPDGGRLYAGGGCSASCSVPMHAAHHARNTWYFALGAAITVMATRRRRRSSDRTKRVA